MKKKKELLILRIIKVKSVCLYIAVAWSSFDSILWLCYVMIMGLLWLGSKNKPTLKTLLLEMAKRWQSQKISLCCAISEAGLNSLDFGGSFVDLRHWTWGHCVRTLIEIF